MNPKLLIMTCDSFRHLLNSTAHNILTILNFEYFRSEKYQINESEINKMIIFVLSITCCLEVVNFKNIAFCGFFDNPQNDFNHAWECLWMKSVKQFLFDFSLKIFYDQRSLFPVFKKDLKICCYCSIVNCNLISKKCGKFQLHWPWFCPCFLDSVTDVWQIIVGGSFASSWTGK
jgi:hypothetical protein